VGSGDEFRILTRRGWPRGLTLCLSTRFIRGKAGLEVDMHPYPAAVAADVDDVAVLQDPVKECGSHDVIAEDVAPPLEGLVRGENGGGLKKTTFSWRSTKPNSSRLSSWLPLMEGWNEKSKYSMRLTAGSRAGRMAAWRRSRRVAAAAFRGSLLLLI